MVCFTKHKKKINLQPTFWNNTQLLDLYLPSQVQGWEDLVAQGVYLTGEGSNPSGSFIYVITLAHLCHLIGGLLALSITTLKSKLNKYSKITT